jgi:7-cyano-7-deazaguanine synthase in queuosine biosynthesis
MAKALVLLSGGMDSVTALYDAARRVEIVGAGMDVCFAG